MIRVGVSGRELRELGELGELRELGELGELKGEQMAKALFRQARHATGNMSTARSSTCSGMLIRAPVVGGYARVVLPKRLLPFVGQLRVACDLSNSGCARITERSDAVGERFMDDPPAPQLPLLPQLLRLWNRVSFEQGITLDCTPFRPRPFNSRTARVIMRNGAMR